MPASAARSTAAARPVAARQIAGTRQFNRFYTRRIGVLEEGLTGTSFTLTEARVLYELAHRDATTSVVLCRDLGIDAGYLSRILARFAKRGLTSRTRSAEDGRERPIVLTARGRKVFAGINQASDKQITALLAPLPPRARQDLLGAMTTIEKLLDAPTASNGAGDAKPAEVILRAPKPGDLGWVVHRHGALYAAEYGYEASFEHMVAVIAAQFAKNFDPAREACWIAEYQGEVAGAIFLMKESDEMARLRLFYVEPSARGLGIGSKLVAACIAGARQFGYHKLTLWTQTELVSARRIYAAAGLTVVGEKPHHSWGRDLIGQDWMMEL
ncbi:MAG TPA: helix-turn-helix domain-containing GNAT family N-acetyltransferase [Magnetospirillaceae bacterium]